jgi:multidrug efflux pump subunit AcrA (membrane-fusion protein)
MANLYVAKADRDVAVLNLGYTRVTASVGGRVSRSVVTVGRDHREAVEVLVGLTAGDTVIVHPGDDLPEGTVVDPVRQQPAAR